MLEYRHRHPDPVAAVEQQLQQFTHRVSDCAGELRHRRRKSTPLPGERLGQTAFFTTGAEAVETRRKIARAHTDALRVIAFSGGFYGRTYMTMALTGKVAPHKIGFARSLLGVSRTLSARLPRLTQDFDAIERLF